MSRAEADYYLLLDEAVLLVVGDDGWTDETAYELTYLALYDEPIAMLRWWKHVKTQEAAE